MIKFLRQPHNIYTGLWGVYYIYNQLIGKGGWISKLALLILMVLSLWNVFELFKIVSINPYFRWLNVLLVLFATYSAIYLVVGNDYQVHGYIEVNKIEYIKSILISLLPIYSYYYYIKKGYVTERWLMYSIFFFFIMAFCEYISTIQYAIESDYNTDTLTNNAGYRFISIVPLIYFWRKKPVLQCVFLLVIAYFTLICAKRGAILILAVLCVLFLLYLVKDEASKGIVALMAMLSIIVIFSNLLLDKVVLSNEFLIQRFVDLSEGNTSGRNELYSNAWQIFWRDSSPLGYIFGNGANGTLKIMGQYAHNDWLEILVNQGLLGVIIYLLYWINFAKSALVLRDAFAYTILIIPLMTSFFSMSINAMPISLIVSIVYCISNSYHDNNVESNDIR